MSVDLYLLPFDCDHPSIVFSHTVLNCDTSYSLWEKIGALPAFPVQAGFTCYLSREPIEGDEEYAEPHYGEVKADAYGTPLHYALAGSLAQLRREPAVDGSPTNRAIWAYLAALPPMTKVALYWH